MPLTLVEELNKSGSKQFIFKSLNRGEIGVSITKYSLDEARFAGHYAIYPIKFDENGDYHIIEDATEAEEKSIDPIRDMYEDLRGDDYFTNMLLKAIRRGQDKK